MLDHIESLCERKLATQYTVIRNIGPLGLIPVPGAISNVYTYMYMYVCIYIYTRVYVYLLRHSDSLGAIFP